MVGHGVTRRDADNRDADNREVDTVDTPAAAGGGTGSSTRRRGLTTAGWAEKRRLDVVHRVGAAGLGGALWVFGILGLVNRLAMFSITGGHVLGLSSNGLLSVISLVVGAVLIGAAVRGGRPASTVTVAVGALFLLSGLANVLVLGTPLNVLAFGMPNVIFSLLAGAVLLFLGAYGRFTGGLPLSNPYQQERRDRDGEQERVPLSTIFSDPADVRAVTELAEAERAAARRATSPAQVTGLAAAREMRRAEDRVGQWRTATGN
jgi:uncharacterized protein DUF4383